MQSSQVHGTSSALQILFLEGGVCLYWKHDKMTMVKNALSFWMQWTNKENTYICNKLWKLLYVYQALYLQNSHIYNM